MLKMLDKMEDGFMKEKELGDKNDPLEILTDTVKADKVITNASVPELNEMFKDPNAFKTNTQSKIEFFDFTVKDFKGISKDKDPFVFITNN